MSTGFAGFDVKPEQGPPLAVPLSFFFVAPIAVIGAGVLALMYRDVFLWRGLPWTMALVHIGTLGFLGSVMLGAMYQMLAVVASPVPATRLGHFVQLELVIGTVALVWAFLTFEPRPFTIAWHSLTPGFLVFAIPVGIALLRAETKTTTVAGIALALLGLIGVVALGALMARARSGVIFTGDWVAWVYTHLTLGGLVWVGGLLTAVSWQVVPMFYLTDPYPRWSRLAVLLCIGGSGIATCSLLAAGAGARHVVFAALPAAVAVWLLHPAQTLRLLATRRRKRVDDSLHFWRLGLLCAPLALGCAVMTWQSDHPRWPMLLGWLVIWGWAGSVIHGMLSRIVPFLVWFHRYSWLVGKQRVPPMRRLWPKNHLRVTLIAHAATTLCGGIAIASASRPAATATGIGLAATGALVLSGLVRVTWHMRGRRAARADAG